MTIQQLFNIQHPILQAPMAGSGSTDLVAAVSNAGGLGATGAAPMKPDVLRTHIQEIRSKTDKPFNINLFAPASERYDQSIKLGPRMTALLESYHRELGLAELPEPRALFGLAEAQLKVLVEEKVPVISFHFGVESDHVERIHRAGLKVISSAMTIGEEETLESLGVDAVIALGASAVQMGTAFLGCPETRIPPLWLQELKTSSPSRTTVTTAMSGKPARGLRNRYITEIESLDEPLLPYSLQYSVSAPLRKRALELGNAEFPTMWSGQGVQMLRELPAAELVESLVRESERLLSELAGSPN